MTDDFQDQEDLQDFPVSSLFRGIQEPRSSQRNEALDLANARKGLRILGFDLYERYPEPTSDRPPVPYNWANRPGRWVGGIPVQIDRVNRKENK